MKVYSLDEVTNMFVGNVGTPKRDAFEEKLCLEIEKIKRTKIPVYQNTKILRK
jgi:hypothetical protein